MNSAIQVVHAVAGMPAGLLYAVILVWLIVESAGAPLPNEAILLFSGYLLSAGRLEFLPTWAAATVGSMGGATLSWYIARRWGPAGVDRVGRYVFLNRGRLSAAQTWFGRWGAYTIFLARLTPVVRTVISYPAGLAAMRYQPFITSTAVGAGIWCAAVLVVGQVAGRHWSDLFAKLHAPLLVIGLAVIVLIVAYLVFEHVLKERLSRGAHS